MLNLERRVHLDIHSDSSVIKLTQSAETFTANNHQSLDSLQTYFIEGGHSRGQKSKGLEQHFKTEVTKNINDSLSLT